VLELTACADHRADDFHRLRSAHAGSFLPRARSCGVAVAGHACCCRWRHLDRCGVLYDPLRRTAGHSARYRDRVADPEARSAPAPVLPRSHRPVGRACHLQLQPLMRSAAHYRCLLCTFNPPAAQMHEVAPSRFQPRYRVALAFVPP
jgi:hypothetical protein